ncbi:hypothetical protein [Spirosoma fluviale]|uniref:Uncharacterized protein n=1 Tax=Spirosoma fluviale TaxID=1597977 RepID=A0A286G3I6_9BACT|nr:hypothetical protein [Spirosoma fluviale]SOD89776.1 hypothetical protein SAMN06269250_3187 [Spirosoma fluviale]
MLTPAQLTAIDQHLRKENWLLNEELIIELTDHYINGISERLAQGMPFDVAMREIQRNFGGRKGLLAMEEEKAKHQSSRIARELRQLIGSYVRPPRLSLTILLIGLAYWATTTGLIGDWMGWFHIIVVCLSTVPIAALFMHNGYLYVAGRKQSMSDFRGVFYRYILAINLVNIPNFFWGNFTIKAISSYSPPYQIIITFVYLFIWTVILDFVLIQPKRFNTLAI